MIALIPPDVTKDEFIELLSQWPELMDKAKIADEPLSIWNEDAVAPDTCIILDGKKIFDTIFSWQ